MPTPRECRSQAGGSLLNSRSWELIELLFEPDGRPKIVSKLGFSSQDIIAEAEKYLGSAAAAPLGTQRGLGKHWK